MCLCACCVLPAHTAQCVHVPPVPPGYKTHATCWCACHHSFNIHAHSSGITTTRLAGKSGSSVTVLLLCLLLSHLMCPAVYVFVSNRLFHLTNELKDRIVPHDNDTKLARNLIQVGCAGAAALGLGWLVRQLVLLQVY